MNDKVRCYLTENVYNQGKDAALEAKSVDKRCFIGYLLTKRLYDEVQ
jgi:hypothetical protein